MTRDCSISNEFSEVNDVVCWALGKLTRPFDSAELIRAVLKGVMDVSGSNRADLLLFQSDMNILFFSESATGDGEGTEGGNISLADSKNSTPVQALAGGHTVLVEDVRESGLLSFSPGSRTLLGVPVIYGSRVHGVLNMEHPESDAYEPGTIRWIESLGSVLAVLLEQSYLKEQVFNLNQKLIDKMTEDAAVSDPTFRAHAERVSQLAVAIANVLSLESSLVEAVRDSGFLHDIGKSGVSENILVKPGDLTDEEMDEMKRHPILGRFLLKPLGFQPAVIEGVASHHERWDGDGYPRGLKGEEIPIAGRILAVAEAFDVMTSDQPYRESIPLDSALEELQNLAGQQFDPDVVEALLKVNLKEL